jgi:Permuted papain-like amidase enzyme, YaeF/YiiX, C92 family
MSIVSRLNPFAYISRKLSSFAIRLLTKPLARYSLTIPNDLSALKRSLRKGDVVLVEGNERVSECIKYLTQSSWSHACLYVGDEPIRRNPELKRKLTEEFGEDAQFLIVKALIESGVVVSPISKYSKFNIRICRPHGLTAADQREVVEAALVNVGRHYDFKNVFDLTRYFLPVHLVPPRFRRKALQFGSGDPTRVICSSLIAECFTKIRFPVLPRYEPFPEGFAPVRKVASLFGRFARYDHPAPGLLRMVSPTLITPRDFDLSPYFAIIKYNVIENSRFDYHKLPWINDREPVSATNKLAESA